MKAILKYFILSAFVALTSIACRDESLTPSPDFNDNVGAVTVVTVNPDRTFFNLLNPLANEFVEFTVDVDGFGITKVNSVDVELIFTEKDRLYDPFQDVFIDSVYAPILLKTINTFPGTVQVTPAEIATALNLDIDDFELGDGFNVIFPINTADGRRLTTALNSELCNQPAQPSFGGCNVAWALTCPSDLAGEYTATLTASNIAATNFRTPQDVTITRVGAGQYQVSDGTLDIFGPDFPIGMRFTDICNTITIQAASVEFPTLVIFDQASGTSYDPATGVITFDVVFNSASCCGLAGTAYTFAATPK